jgi:polysaccharide pyruvyl transferase WcaK-like protein
MVLRATSISWTRIPDSTQHILVGNTPLSYREGLGLEPADRLYTSSLKWTVCALLALAASRATTFVYAPGAQSLKPSRSEWLHALSNAAISTWSRLVRGRIVKVGRSLSGSSTGMARIERYIASSARLYSYRDTASGPLVGLPSTPIVPDVAMSIAPLLSAAPVSVDNRKFIALSFRGDRPHDQHSIEAIATYAESKGLRLQFVTQVRRDNEKHSTWATRLNARHVAWDDSTSHVEQLESVRRAYSQSAFIFTNRLHAAIFAAKMGAVPVGLSSIEDSKIRNHFEALGLGEFAFTSLDASSLDRLSEPETGQQALRALIQSETEVMNGRDVFRRVLCAPHSTEPPAASV